MPAIDPQKIPSTIIERTSWILVQLRLRGETFTSLADANGIPRSALSLACRAPHFQAETVLAKALGLTPEVLFSERYASNGVRLYRVMNRKATPSGRNGKDRVRA